MKIPRGTGGVGVRGGDEGPSEEPTGVREGTTEDQTELNPYQPSWGSWGPLRKEVTVIPKP